MARDYRAEYARRQERARDLGYGSYREQRAARSAGQPRPGDTAGRRQIIPTGDGGFVGQLTPGGKGQHVLAAAIRRADEANARQGYGQAQGEGEKTGGGRLHITATLADGSQVDLTGKGGINPSTLLAMMDEYGGLDDAVDALGDDMYGAGAVGGGAIVAYTVGMT